MKSWQQEEAEKCCLALLENLVCNLMQGLLALNCNKQLAHVSNKRIRRTAIIMRAVLIVYQSLRDNQRIQKRDVYYRDVKLFEYKQSMADRAVEWIGRYAMVPRESLNIVGGNRGLLYGGPLVVAGITKFRIENIKYEDNGMRHCIPYAQDIVSIDADCIDFCLIVEKEAIFSIIADDYSWICQRIGKRFLMVTAKGYPDRATLLFLGVLRRQRPDLPFMAIVDWDPYGIDIARNYRRGLSDGQGAIADIRVIGVTAEDVCAEKLIPLTLGDRKRILFLLRTCPEWLFARNQVLCMNDWHGKMELNVVGDGMAFTSEYLVQKIKHFI